MKTYELTYLISSGLSTVELESAVKDIDAFIQSKEGVVLRLDKTIAQPLAYPVKKHGSGYFVTLIFQMAENHIKEIQEKLNREKRILRHVILVKKPAREVKERRTRRVLVAAGISEPLGSMELLSDKDKHKGEKVEMEDVEKKLDEILGE